MTRLYFGLLLGVSGVILVPDAAARPQPKAAPVCAERPGEPSGDARLRSFQIAVCPYNGAELTRRLSNLLEARSGDELTVELMERAFGLPRLHTVFDDPRHASYTAIVEAAPGQDGWKLMLSFEEGFWPMLDSRPHRFRGTMRPVLLNPRERGDRSIQVRWLGPSVTAPPACLRIADLSAAGRKRGWREQPPVPIMSSHGPQGWSFDLQRADLQVSTPIPNNGGCIDNLRLSAAANPPVPPITPEEEANLRLESARVMERAILAHPAQGKDDENARNAEAKFYRDASARSYFGAPDPIGDRIDTLDVDQLRNLLKRAVTGNAWGHAREDCEAAITESEPPAALLRRARNRGLDEVELKALETFCTIYIQGRRFKPRAEPATPASPR